MRSPIFDEVLHELEALAIDDATKLKCLNAVRAIGRRNGVTTLLMRERLTFVTHLLDRGESRGDVRRRLVGMHSISVRQALRVIAQAERLRHFHERSVTKTADNERYCSSSQFDGSELSKENHGI